MQTSYSKRRLLFFVFIFVQIFVLFFCLLVFKKGGEKEEPVSLHHGGSPNWPALGRPHIYGPAGRPTSPHRTHLGPTWEPGALQSSCPPPPCPSSHTCVEENWPRGKRGDWLAPCSLCRHRVTSRTVLFQLVSFRPDNRRSEPRKLKQRKNQDSRRAKIWSGWGKKKLNKKGNRKEEYPKQR